MENTIKSGNGSKIIVNGTIGKGNHNLFYGLLTVAVAKGRQLIDMVCRECGRKACGMGKGNA